MGHIQATPRAPGELHEGGGWPPSDVGHIQASPRGSPSREVTANPRAAQEEVVETTVTSPVVAAHGNPCAARPRGCGRQYDDQKPEARRDAVSPQSPSTLLRRVLAEPARRSRGGVRHRKARKQPCDKSRRWVPTGALPSLLEVLKEALAYACASGGWPMASWRRATSSTMAASLQVLPREDVLPYQESRRLGPGPRAVPWIARVGSSRDAGGPPRQASTQWQRCSG